MMEIRAAGLGRRAGGRAILAGVDLEFSPGVVNVILGPNGAGKSTLLRLLGLLDRPGSGDIVYDGRWLSAMNGAERVALRRRCGFVFQAPLLLAASVEANLRFGARLRSLAVDDEALRRALAATGLAGKKKQEARLLSGGEKQRLQLARVMLLDPDLYLLDEPTANLDPLSVKNIEAAIARLAREGKTVILATHNLMQARLLAGRIVFLQAGRLVQAGSPSEVLSRPLSLDIAEFSAAENILSGTLARRDGRTVLDCGPLNIEVVSEREAGRAAAVIRPEDILVSLQPLDSSARNSFRGTVSAISDLGAVMALVVDCSGVAFTVFLTRISCAQMGLAAGGSVALTFKATAVHLLAID
ncbi:MAG: ABC transporter ATP-binding protein [Acidobacteria bacterium]|jgi:molybdopterin-binding protein|nr:ABC transporter ATP-binding protein [Acidobacteriota bacterium]